MYQKMFKKTIFQQNNMKKLDELYHHCLSKLKLLGEELHSAKREMDSYKKDIDQNKDSLEQKVTIY